jgi:hypothetical protein
MRTDVWQRGIWVVMGMAVLVVAGCRAPRPSFNFWAPFGSSRVAPPKTGSYNTPENYYPNGSVPAVGGAASGSAPAATTKQAPVTPVRPSSNFPIDSSSSPSGFGSVNDVNDVRVGKWRSPNHVPQVRSVSFDRNAAPAAVLPAKVPTVRIPTKGGAVGGEPQQLRPNQTSIAIPMTTASKAVPDPAVVRVGFETTPTSQPAATAGGWNRRGPIAPK